MICAAWVTLTMRSMITISIVLVCSHARSITLSFVYTSGVFLWWYASCLACCIFNVLVGGDFWCFIASLVCCIHGDASRSTWWSLVMFYYIRSISIYQEDKLLVIQGSCLCHIYCCNGSLAGLERQLELLLVFIMLVCGSRKLCCFLLNICYSHAYFGVWPMVCIVLLVWMMQL